MKKELKKAMLMQRELKRQEVENIDKQKEELVLSFLYSTRFKIRDEQEPKD